MDQSETTAATVVSITYPLCIMLKFFKRKKQLHFFHQTFQGRIRGMLGWIPEKDKNVLYLELHACDERWNWTPVGKFRYLDIKDVRAVFEDCEKVIQKHVRGE